MQAPRTTASHPWGPKNVYHVPRASAARRHSCALPHHRSHTCWPWGSFCFWALEKTSLFLSNERCNETHHVTKPHSDTSKCVTCILCFILFRILHSLFHITLVFCFNLGTFPSILSHLINLCLKLLLCISTLAPFLVVLSYVDKSCAWSTAPVIKLSAESAVPCCNFLWWWTPGKQIVPPLCASTHPCPSTQHTQLCALMEGPEEDGCKRISWGSAFKTVTALS